MTANYIDSCLVCKYPLVDHFVVLDDDGFMVDLTKTVLHTTKDGTPHKIHKQCAYQRFVQQLENEPAGLHPANLTNMPFSCPICQESLTLEQATRASSIGLAAMVGFCRSSKVEIPI